MLSKVQDLTALHSCSTAMNQKTSEEQSRIVSYFTSIEKHNFICIFLLRPKEDPASLAASTLSDFQIIRTLGLGEFSHVDLVNA